MGLKSSLIDVTNQYSIVKIRPIMGLKSLMNLLGTKTGPG